MMDDTDNFPYDNVEFPVRRPQPTSTGVGPSPRLHIQPSPQEKHQTSGLAPVIEMEGTELETEDKVTSFSRTSSSTTSTNASGRQASSFNQSSSSTSTPIANQVTVKQTKAESPSSNTSAKFPPNKPTVVSIQQGKVVTKQPGSHLFPFERNDFNPRSQEVLNKTYTDHRSYSALYNLVLKQGFELQKPLYDAQSKLRDKLSYEQLLQGMLFDGERLLLSGHWIYFTKVEYLDETGKTETRPALGNGRACLTNKRLLFLVAESNTDANLTPVGKCKKQPSSYKLSLSQKDDVVYQSLPLSTFRSVELGVSVGAEARTKIVSEKNCLCSCLGKQWKAAPPVTQAFNKRIIQMGISLPPWGTNSIVIMHVHPDLSLTLSRDFVCYVQTYATQLH